MTVGVVGGVGAARAMAPTLLARRADGRGRHALTPAPETVVPREASEALRYHAVGLADHLGLRGVCQVDAFVNVESRAVIVLDVRAAPPLDDGSPLLAAALLEAPPLLPHQLLRLQLAHAVAAAEAGRTAADAARLGAPAWFSQLASPGAAAAGAGAAASDAAPLGDDYDLSLDGSGLGGDGDDALGDDFEGLAATTWTQ